MFNYRVQRGQTALVTGASSGIGAGFIRALAAGGMNVILTARSGERLTALAAEVSGRHKVRAEVISADLSAETGVESVWLEVERRGLVVDLLVNNAAVLTRP
jgi:short-subunit dehydrogenase